MRIYKDVFTLNSQSLLSRWCSPVNWAQRLIRLYQVCLSPYMPSRCRFVPTCSNYALEALESYGLIKGMVLTLSRLLRCHPFCKCGVYDPVPRSFRK